MLLLHLIKNWLIYHLLASQLFLDFVGPFFCIKFHSVWAPEDVFVCVCVCLFVCLFLVFLGLHLQHMDIPCLGVELEQQLPAYTTVTQCRIPDPLTGARGWACILVDTSWVHYHWAMSGTPVLLSWKVPDSLTQLEVQKWDSNQGLNRHQKLCS